MLKCIERILDDYQIKTIYSAQYNLNLCTFSCRSYYTRRKFRPIYAKVMNSYANAHRKSSTYQRYAGANSLSLVTGLMPFTTEMALFEFPFNELLVRITFALKFKISL